MREQALEAQVVAALHRCASGDRSALRVIYDLEAGRMIGVAMRIVRRKDLAEESVHDAFMSIWRASKTFDPQRGSGRTWIYAILRNRAISVLRDEGRFAPDDGIDLLADPQDGDALHRLPETSRLRRCLEQLDARRRAAVIMSYVHGLSHGELAGKLGVPLGTAKSLTRRGLISLQECMG